MSVKRRRRQHDLDTRSSDRLLRYPRYVYAELDRAPLIVGFDHQLAQQREADSLLRQIAAIVEFELACLTHGIDPRKQGRG